MKGGPYLVSPGARFTRWVVLRLDRSTADDRYWLCRCDCGTERVVRQHQLTSGHSHSCGCRKRENVGRAARARLTTHGMSESPEYNIWRLILDRCINPKSRAYANYGGRGISICDQWRHSFEEFFAAVGRRPKPELTIERIENNRGYEPGNVRWATRSEQANNKRTNRRITWRGETRNVSEWAKFCGFKSQTLERRLWRGWSIERALTEKLHK